MAKKKTVRRKAARKKTPSARKKAARKKPRCSGNRRSSGNRPVRAASISDARVSGTAELGQHFLKDYEARQVFTFLEVKTLKELEGHSPQDIIDRLTAPMLLTVNRIRKALALQNRCLSGDQKFAVEFKRQMQAVLGK